MPNFDCGRGESRRCGLGLTAVYAGFGQSRLLPAGARDLRRGAFAKQHSPEIREKMLLYFDAGSAEVWLCGLTGGMTFFGPRTPQEMRVSEICPDFPKQVQLR